MTENMTIIGGKDENDMSDHAAAGRPFVFCHMLVSLDGKISGTFLDTLEGIKAVGTLYDLAFGPGRFYAMQGWLSGRVTTDENFTFYARPDLDPGAPAVPDGDYITNTDFGMYYVSVDPLGVLGWNSPYLQYETTKAAVIEVLTEQASNAYRAFLRSLGIPYIIAGEKDVEWDSLLEKLKSLFHIDMLMLQGGGILNWKFMESGLCDELSLVVAAAADGAENTPSVFRNMAYPKGRPLHFALEKTRQMESGALWLRYKVLNPEKMWTQRSGFD